MPTNRPVFRMIPAWNDGSWQERSACRDAEADLFFSTEDEDQKRAREYCVTCPVQQECLRHAIENREMYGIWGGMFEGERRAIIRDRRRQERERRRKSDAA